MTGTENQQDILSAPLSCMQQQTAQVLSLCHQGQTADAISRAVGLSTAEVQEIIAAASQKSRILYLFMDRETPATFIDVCGVTRKVRITNLTDDLLSRAFGIREEPDWNDYEAFLESRCMPRTRYGIREELRELGVDSYDPFQIIEKTAGRVHGDGQWLRKMNREWIAQYDTVLETANNEHEIRERLLRLLAQNDGEIRNENNGCHASRAILMLIRNPETAKNIDSLSQVASVSNRASSKGNQRKWTAQGIWYKADSLGYEALAEVLISRLLEKTNAAPFVRYSYVGLEQKGVFMHGCQSEDFMASEDDKVVSVERLFQTFYGESCTALSRCKGQNPLCNGMYRSAYRHSGIRQLPANDTDH